MTKENYYLLIRGETSFVASCEQDLHRVFLSGHDSGGHVGDVGWYVVRRIHALPYLLQRRREK